MLTVSVAGHANIKQRIALLKMPNAKRQRVLAQIGRKGRTASRKRIRSQSDLSGRAWAPRKNRNKRKMLRGLGRRIYYKANPEKVDISLNPSAVARIANEHQKGLTETMTAEKMRKIHGEPDYEGSATRAQAKALRAEGYKIRRAKGKGWKQPSLKWIQENLNAGQAGIVLRILRGETRNSKKSWKIKLPARSFLGATDQEIEQFTQTVIDQTIKSKG